MKLSVSLPDEDVAFLDTFAREHRDTRSGALLRAVRLLRASQLQVDYAHAWIEWEESGEAAIWESTVRDGLETREAR